MQGGTQPDCADNAMLCTQPLQSAKTPGIWNPLPYFDTVKADGQLDRIQPVSNFYTAAQAGTLPAVAHQQGNDTWALLFNLSVTGGTVPMALVIVGHAPDI